MLNQLRTIQPFELTTVNDMLREVYVNDIFSRKAEKDYLRRYRSEAAMTTTTVECSDMKRDVREVVCHNCEKKGHYANKKMPRTLSLGIPRRGGVPCTKRGRIQR